MAQIKKPTFIYCEVCGCEFEEGSRVIYSDRDGIMKCSVCRKKALYNEKEARNENWCEY